MLYGVFLFPSWCQGNVAIITDQNNWLGNADQIGLLFIVNMSAIFG